MESKGRRCRGRTYPWGVVEGSTHKQFFILISLCFYKSFYCGMFHLAGICKVSCVVLVRFVFALVSGGPGSL